MGCLWETQRGFWWRLFQAEGPLNSVLISNTPSCPFIPYERFKFVKVWLVQNTPTHLPNHASTGTIPVTSNELRADQMCTVVYKTEKYTEAKERGDTKWTPTYHASTRHLGILHSHPALHNILFARTFIRGDADKSLARPTSRYRRTESIVSLERGVCPCA